MAETETVAQPAVEDERIILDPEELGAQDAYHLLNAVVAPRPIAWVSTRGPAGVANVAPHSYFTVLATQPPTLGFVSVGRKDTLRNIEATGEYVVNIAGLDLAERLNLTSADFPPEESEFAWAGLTPVGSDLVAAPRVGEAPVAMETRLVEVKPIGNSFLVIGEVLRWHLKPAIMAGGRPDPARIRPFGRHSGSQYSQAGGFFNLTRPTWADLSRDRRDGAHLDGVGDERER